MEKVKCPKCGWSARVDWLASENKFICRHCGHKWAVPKESK
jgi:transposase-like protein